MNRLGKDPFVLRRVIQRFPENRGAFLEYQVAIWCGDFFVGLGTPVQVPVNGGPDEVPG
jgi:hypothetical protein